MTKIFTADLNPIEPDFGLNPKYFGSFSKFIQALTDPQFDPSRLKKIFIIKIFYKNIFITRR